MRIIVMFGSTCSGKTTHAKFLAAAMGFRHINSGNIARAMMDKETATSFSQGGLSPHDKEIVDTIHHELTVEKVGAVIDGFPRTVKHYNTFKVWINGWLYGKMNGVTPVIVHLDVPSGLLWKRAKARSRDEFDTKEATMKRDALYRELTLPLIQDAVDTSNWSLARLVIKQEKTIAEIQEELSGLLCDFGKRETLPERRNVTRHI